MTVPIRLDHRPQTLIEQARWLAQHKADQTAVVLITGDQESVISYRAFFEQAARYAAAMQQVGAAPGDIVVLVLQHGADVLYSFWGALVMRAVPSIFPFLSDKLDPERYFNSVRQMIQHAGARIVITNTELEPALHQHLDGIESLAAIINIDHLPVTETPFAWPKVDAESTAFLQHSSGSTGLQKGVMLSHRAIINQIASYSHAIALTQDDVIVSWLPLYHDMGLIAGFIMPIMQGLPLVLMSPFQWVRDPKMLLYAAQRHHGTLCWLPNFAYNFMALQVRESDIAGLDLSSLRAVINCSEPVYATSHQALLKRFAPYGLREEALSVCYAMAENTFAVTQTPMETPPIVDLIDRQLLAEQGLAQPASGDSPTIAMVSCGRPVPNCEIRVVDAQRQPLAERQVGEITLRSDSMLSGYYHRQDATESALADGWFYTGDLGYLADGELYVTGRKKDLIIIGGKNIYPQDVEQLINEISGVHAGRTVAFGILNERLATEDIAIIAEVDTEDIEERGQIERDIRASIVKNLDVTARYVHLVDLKWLVKTSSGKIARQANKEKFLAGLKK